MRAFSLDEIKVELNAKFAAFQNREVALDDNGRYLDGLTNTGNWATQAVLDLAEIWWLNEKHGALTANNDQRRREMGPAWEPNKRASTRGPAVKEYSFGRKVMNFEYFDNNAPRRSFNYHVPLCPPAPVPAVGAAAPASDGWKLVNDEKTKKWVHRLKPNAWTGKEDPRGF